MSSVTFKRSNDHPSSSRSAVSRHAAAGADSGSLAGRLLVVCCVLMLASLGINWFSLAEVAGFAIRPVHLFIIGFALLVAVRPPVISRMLASIAATQFGWFFAACAAMVVLHALAIVLTPGGMGKVTLLLKEVVYTGMGLVMLVAFYTVFAVPAKADGGRRAEPWLRVGAVLGVLTFFVVVILLFASKGENVIASYLIDVAKADTKRLQFYYYRTIFGTFVDEDTGVALRNSIVGAFVLYFIVLFATRASRSLGAWLWHWGLASASAFVVLTSISRSNILALAAAMLVPFVLVCLRKPSRMKTALVATLVIAVTATTVASLIDLSEVPVVKILQERFVEGIENDPRGAMLQVAMRKIGEEPVWGHGFGAQLYNPSTNNTERIHNLVVASYYELGIPGLTCALLILATLIFAWWDACRRLLANRDSWRLSFSPVWAMALPTLPLIRCMVSGNGGQFTIIEWACLALFFALLAANETVRAAEPNADDQPYPSAA